MRKRFALAVVSIAILSGCSSASVGEMENYHWIGIAVVSVILALVAIEYWLDKTAAPLDHGLHLPKLMYTTVKDGVPCEGDVKIEDTIPYVWANGEWIQIAPSPPEKELAMSLDALERIATVGIVIGTKHEKGTRT